MIATNGSDRFKFVIRNPFTRFKGFGGILATQPTVVGEKGKSDCYQLSQAGMTAPFPFLSPTSNSPPENTRPALPAATSPCHPIS